MYIRRASLVVEQQRMFSWSGGKVVEDAVEHGCVEASMFLVESPDVHGGVTLVRNPVDEIK